MAKSGGRRKTSNESDKIKKNREDLVKKLVSAVVSKLDDRDFDEHVSLAITGTIIRIREAPSNKLEFDEVVARVGRGELQDFAVKWSNSTISWPNEYLVNEAVPVKSMRGRRVGVIVSSKAEKKTKGQ